MFEYTISSLNDTLDRIKKLTYIAQVIIQLVYIIFIIFRVINHAGVILINIILLTLSIFYLIYHIATKQEFYTKRQLKRKKTIRLAIKISKYIANMFLIYIAVNELNKGIAINSNNTIIMIILMILGIIFSVIFEILINFTENQINIIKMAFIIDMNVYKNSFIINRGLRAMGVNLDEVVPNYKEDELYKEASNANERQKKKRNRKKVFEAKIK